MADQKLRYVIEVDASKATPELRKFLAALEASTTSTKGLTNAEKRWEQELRRIEGSLTGVNKLLDKTSRSREAVAVTLPAWQRLSLAVTGVNQALSLLDRTVGRAGRALVAQFAGVANEADRLLTLSRRFDLPVEQVGRLDFVARRAGVSFEGLGHGVRLFATQLTQARAGQEQAVRLFRSLGIEGDQLSTLAARGLVPAFLAVAQRLSTVSDSTKQAAIGTQLFRGAWDGLKVVLADTNGDLDGAAKRADALRAVLSEDLALAANRVKGAFFDLDAATRGFFARLAGAGLFDAVADGINSISDAIASLDDETVDQLATSFAQLADSLSDAASSNLDAVVRYIASIADGVREVNDLMRSPNGIGLLFNPIGAPFKIAKMLFGGGGDDPGTPDAGPFVAGGLRGDRGSVGDLRRFIRNTGATLDPDLGDLFGSEQTQALQAYQTALQGLRDKFIEMRDALTILRGEGDKNALAGERLYAELTRLATAAKTQVDPAVRLLVDDFVAMQDAIDSIQFDQGTLQKLRDQLALMQASTEEARRALDLQIKLRDAAKAGATPQQLAEFANLERSIDALERFERSAFDIFDAIGGAADTMFDAIARGTLDLQDAFDSLKVGIVRSFVDAFKQGFAEKLGFESKFKVNIAQFVQNIAGIVTGKSGGGGLFGGVFGPQGAGASLVEGATPAGFVGPGAPIAGGAGTSGLSSLAGTLGSLVTVVGSLYSIASIFQGQFESANDVRKKTGDQGAANSQLALSTAFTGVSAAYFAGVGASVGSVVPGIGTLVGAAIGAAVGAAIGQAVTGAINGAVNNATNRALREGLTQQQLNQSVGDDTKVKIATAGLSSIFPNALQFLIPSIDSIFDKIFQQLLGDAGLSTAGGAARNPISSLSRDVRDTLQANRGTNYQLGRVLALLVGAGEQRGLPFSRILQVSAGQQAERSGRDVEDIISRAFVRIFEGSFTDAFRIARALDGRGGGKATAAVAEGFRTQSAALDFGVIGDVFNASADARGGLFGKQARKASQEAVGEALSEALSSGSFANFGTKLGDVVRDAFTRGISQAITQTPIGDLLGEAFQLSRQTSRRLRREGFTDDNLARVGADFEGAAERVLTLLTAGGGGEFLATVGQAFAKAQDAIELFSVVITAATGDFNDLRDAVEGAIAEELSALREFRTFVESAALRTAALTGEPFAALEASRDQAFTAAGNQGAAFGERFNLPDASFFGLLRFITLLGEFQERIQEFSAAGSQIPEWEALIDLVTDGLLGGNESGLAAAITAFNSLDPATQADAFRDLYESSLAYLEAEIELQNARIQFYGQAKDSFQALIDQVSTIRFGRFGQRGIFDRLSGELPGLATDLASTDEGTRAGAISRLQEIGPQLIQLASQLFAPGSAAMVSFLNMLEPLLGDAFSISSTEEARAQAAKEAAQTMGEELAGVFGPVLASIEGSLEDSVAARLSDIYTILSGTGATGIYGVLTAIANAESINATFPEARALGGPVTAGTPYLVGERGAELFVPDTSGYIQPNPNAMPSVLSVSLGDVDVQVSAALSTTAIVDVVVDALARRTRPDLTRAVQVALGAR